jgi:putative cardiolipin synthase
MRRNAVAALLLGLAALSVGTGCSTLPAKEERPASFALAGGEDTLLGRKVLALAADHPGESGFRLLASGLDAFVARGALAHLAERSIDVQYYLFHDDLVGRLLAWELLRAADRGVRVRLLVDDMDLAGRDLSLAALDAHPNVEVRIFNPFRRGRGRISQFLTGYGSVTRRMHNKSFTVDGQATILGGRNIGDEYFEADPELAFADLDVLAVGPVARDVSAAFDRYWNSEPACPVAALAEGSPAPEDVGERRRKLEDYAAAQEGTPYLQALRGSALADDLRRQAVRYSWGKGVVLYDLPEKVLRDEEEKELHLAPRLKPYVAGAERELILFSPYFVPGEAGTAFLNGLSARGVRVRILTNSLASSDVAVVHAGYAAYRRPLLRGGVELYEMNRNQTPARRKGTKRAGGSSKASLHAKSFVIGSMNLDPRAFVHNTEIGVVVSSPEIARAMGEWFDRNVDRVAFRLELKREEGGSEPLLWHGVVDGEPQTFDADPYTGFLERLGIRLLGLLPIESQL